MRKIPAVVVWAATKPKWYAHAVVGLLLSIGLTSCTLPVKSTVIKTANDEFTRFEFTPVKGPPVEYYISKPQAPSPLVIYLQGSGCTPVFPATGFGDDHASTVFSSTTMARTYPITVMVIDKPYAPKRPPQSSGVATDCPKEFNDYFSLDAWVSHIEVAYEHALGLPWVDSRRTLIIGISEGATVAAALAARDQRITDVALVGGSGPTQFYDFVVNAYASSPEHTKVLAALEKLDSKRAAIAAAPLDSTRFEWGHSYKRWSSFFSSSSVDNLEKSDARVYLVSGMADTDVPILSTELLYAELVNAGRDITMRRIPDGNHALMRAGVSIDEVESEFDRIIHWYLNRPWPASGAAR